MSYYSSEQHYRRDRAPQGVLLFEHSLHTQPFRSWDLEKEEAVKRKKKKKERLLLRQGSSITDGSGGRDRGESTGSNGSGDGSSDNVLGVDEAMEVEVKSGGSSGSSGGSSTPTRRASVDDTMFVFVSNEDRCVVRASSVEIATEWLSVPRSALISHAQRPRVNADAFFNDPLNGFLEVFAGDSATGPLGALLSGDHTEEINDPSRTRSRSTSATSFSSLASSSSSGSLSSSLFSPTSTSASDSKTPGTPLSSSSSISSSSFPASPSAHSRGSLSTEEEAFAQERERKLSSPEISLGPAKCTLDHLLSFLMSPHTDRPYLPLLGGLLRVSSSSSSSSSSSPSTSSSLLPPSSTALLSSSASATCPNDFRTLFCLNHTDFLPSAALVARLSEFAHTPSSSYTTPRAAVDTKIQVLRICRQWMEQLPCDVAAVGTLVTELVESISSAAPPTFIPSSSSFDNVAADSSTTTTQQQQTKEVSDAHDLMQAECGAVLRSISAAYLQDEARQRNLSGSINDGFGGSGNSSSSSGSSSSTSSSNSNNGTDGVVPATAIREKFVKKFVSENEVSLHEPERIARELTVRDAENLMCCGAREFTKRNWTEKDVAGKADGILRMVKVHNLLWWPAPCFGSVVCFR